MAVDWDTYRRSFIAQAQLLGRNQAFIDRGLEYAEPLIAAGLPVIVDPTHLAGLLGFDPPALLSALEQRHHLYRTSYIPKRAGGYRRIDAPVESLRNAQVWILRNILDCVRPHTAATAFRTGASIKSNAQSHVGQHMVVSMDVANFFPSLQLENVLAEFMRLGYSDEVAVVLVNLTTVGTGLPQGAPTSPALSNLLMRRFDEAMTEEAKRTGWQYTRYADDITLSGFFHIGKAIAVVRELLAVERLTLNEAKTRLMLPHQRQEVTGVVVNSRVRPPRTLRRYLRHHVHMLSKFGMPEQITDQLALEKYKRHIRGVAEFVLFLDPSDRDAKNAVATLGRIRY